MQTGSELAIFGTEIRTKQFRVSHKEFAAMSLPPRGLQGAGRFDDPSDHSEAESHRYRVMYTGESPTAAFVESLARYRSTLQAIELLLSDSLLSIEEREGIVASHSPRGIITEDWCQRFQLTSSNVRTQLPIFDLTKAAAVQTLRAYMAPSLIALGLDDLDFSHVLGENRDLTRAISRWIWSMTTDSGGPLFSGIRYRSRFDPDCICLALYEHRYEVDGDVDIQHITPDTPGFAEAASTLRLRIA